MQTNNEYVQENSSYASSFCPKCGSVITDGCTFCPRCGSKIKVNRNQSQNASKIVMVLLALVIVVLLSVIIGMVVNRMTYSPDKSEVAELPSQTQAAEITETVPDKTQLINECLNEVKELYDSGDYKGAQKKLYSINEEDMNEEQRGNYNVFEANIDSKLNSSGAEESQIKHAGNVNNYSIYDDRLSPAYINGAKTGNVYFWVASTGDGYTATIPNGTLVYNTLHSSDGRTLVKWNGSYGWITSQYVSSDNTPRYYSPSGYYINGAASGNVYVWSSMYGSTYYATLPNGTEILPTGRYGNGRTEIYWGRGRAWITSDYVW